VALRVLLLWALLAPAAALGAEPIEVIKEEPLSPRLVEYTFKTGALDEDTVVRVLLPSSYAAHPDRRYPVLYLLHGCCDYDVRGSQAWTTHGEAEQATEGLDIIVVMPDGGRAGFYSDWFNNGLGGPPRWETYNLGQLVPWVDGHLRTIAAREGRVLAGLSMGGFGAMKYAARHPDDFVAAASYSGAVDTNLADEALDPLTVQDGGVPGSAWGKRETEEVRWRAHNPWDLAENLRGLHLELRAGNGRPGELDGDDAPPYDALETSTHEQSVSLHQRFDSLGIAHVWDEYGNGTHTWPYWARDLRRTLPEFMSVLADPPAPPARVTFTAVEPEYEVYDWRVRLERPALEFSRLEDAGRDGFTLAGSGSATVTTPAVYDPGAAYTAGPSTVVADDTGRLTIQVPLGPGNAMQQYRPGADTKVRRAQVRVAPTPSAGAPPPPQARVPCASRRRFRVHLPRRLRGKVRATVAGRRVRVRRGRRHRFVVVDLRGRPQGVYRVVLSAHRKRIVRTFRTCRAR
jgi:S-formylglutathione hydrolase FrmB